VLQLLISEDIMIAEVKCEKCGKKFYGTARAKYCSGKCRVASHREKVQQVQGDEKSK
jgi:hypothetical protein